MICRTVPWLTCIYSPAIICRTVPRLTCIQFTVHCNTIRRTEKCVYALPLTTDKDGDLWQTLNPVRLSAGSHGRGRLRLKCDGTRTETTFLLSGKRTSPFKSARASVQSTTGSRGVRISGSNAGYTKFRGSMKSTGYPLHSPVSPSLPLPCVTVCHHISTGLYLIHTLKTLVPGAARH